jgi:hypothetical protein
MAGYSGTPLVKKLGVKEGINIHVINAPAGYRRLLTPLPAGLQFASAANASTHMVHVFATERAQLARTENTIREVALPLGFVDIKVCAVTDIWSGLKLVVRKELRRSPP